MLVVVVCTNGGGSDPLFHIYMRQKGLRNRHEFHKDGWAVAQSFGEVPREKGKTCGGQGSRSRSLHDAGPDGIWMLSRRTSGAGTRSSHGSSPGSASPAAGLLRFGASRGNRSRPRQTEPWRNPPCPGQ